MRNPPSNPRFLIQERPSRPGHLHGDTGAAASGRGEPGRRGHPRPGERPPAEERGRGGGLHEAPRAAGQPEGLQLHPLTHLRRAGVFLLTCLMIIFLLSFMVLRGATKSIVNKDFFCARTEY